MSAVQPEAPRHWREALSREEINQLVETNNWRGWLSIALDWGLVAAAMALVTALPNPLTIVLAIALVTMWGLYSLQIFVSKRVSPQNRLKYGLTILFPITAMLVPLAFLEISQRYLTVRGTPLNVISFCS